MYNEKIRGNEKGITVEGFFFSLEGLEQEEYFWFFEGLQNLYKKNSDLKTFFDAWKMAFGKSGDLYTLDKMNAADFYPEMTLDEIEKEADFLGRDFDPSSCVETDLGVLCMNEIY